MKEDAPLNTRGTGAGHSPVAGKRRPSNPRETQRRQEWARQQAEIGYEWQRTRLGKEVSR